MVYSIKREVVPRICEYWISISTPSKVFQVNSNLLCKDIAKRVHMGMRRLYNSIFRSILLPTTLISRASFIPLRYFFSVCELCITSCHVRSFRSRSIFTFSGMSFMFRFSNVNVTMTPTSKSGSSMLTLLAGTVTSSPLGLLKY